MKKCLIAIVLICMLVLLTGQIGCKKTDVQEGDYHTGYQGLVINFLKEAPPKEMYENTDFKIALEIRNKGTCDIGPSEQFCRGHLQIEGFDTTIVQGFGGAGYDSPYAGAFSKPIPDPEGGSTQLPGKSTYNLEGGYDVLTFPSRTTYAWATLPDSVDSYTPTILATACYKYITEATPAVCVDPDPYGIDVGAKACTIKDVALSGGQGAPVAVTKVEENIIIPSPKGGGGQSAKYAQFKIFVEHVGDKGSKKTSTEGVGAVGKGIVVHPDYVFKEDYEGCTNPNYLNINKIIFSGSLSGVTLSCGQDISEITLDKNGKGFIICKSYLPEGIANTAYTAPLYLKLYYGYVTSVSTTAKIVKLPGG